MKWTDVFIQRPVATLTLNLALILLGWFAYPRLPVAELPTVDFPTLSVSANLPGADPETLSATVATPLERAFTQIPGLETLNSTSSTGNTQITLTFALDRDIDSAATDVQNAIAQTVRQLPSTLPQPPTVRKSNPADQPILFLALSADAVPMTELNDFAEIRLADALSRVEGVAQVNVFGAKRYATRIRIDPMALNARNISLLEVQNAVRSGSALQATGTLRGDARDYNLDAREQLTDAKGFNRLVLRAEGGQWLRLGDVGLAVDSVQNDQQEARFNGRPAIVLAVTRQPGANTVAIADGVRERLTTLMPRAPGDARVDVVYDRSQFVRESLYDVGFTLGLSVLLVVLVIWVFLREASATVIAALALPASLVGTLAIMWMLGYSLDNLSLMALTLSVGFVVDDAIVVLENIARYREQGLGRLEAARRGAGEIGFTVMSMTISLVAVFIPILFMGGVVGRLFREFAVTTSVAILLSAAVSLTLTAMLAAHLKLGKDTHPPRRGAISRGLERALQAWQDGYMRSLRCVLQWPKLLVLLTVALLAATGWLYGKVKTGFIPSQDAGVIFASVRAPDGTSFAELLPLQQRAAQIVQQHPGVAAVMSTAGLGGNFQSGGNLGRMTIRLKPRTARSQNAEAIIGDLRKAVGAIPLLQVAFNNPPAIRLGRGGGGGNYQYVLQGNDWQSLDVAANQLIAAMRDMPWVRDVSSDLQLASPTLKIDIDRERAAALGVSITDIQSTLYAAYGSARISNIYTPTAQYDVLLEIDPRYRKDQNALQSIRVPSARGTLVPLMAVARIRMSAGPLNVSRYQQQPAATISFEIAPNASLGAVTDAITQATSALPAGVSGTFSGTADLFKSAMVDLPLLLLVSVVVIYGVLAILYEDFLHPITILTALPLAAVGALLALWATELELNVFSFVGLILLVGLVKKNGIIMVDFAVAQRRESASAEAAILAACAARFRPIMMTTFAAVLGSLPLALGHGAGMEVRQPLGVAVVGGLMTSQLLTLYLTPAFYLLMERLRVGREQRSPQTA